MSISYDDRFWTSLREVFVYWAKKKLGTDVVQYEDTDGTVKTYNLNLFTSIREAVLALANSEDSSGGTGTIPVLPNGQYPSSLPPEGSVYLYVRADNKLYIYDSTGKETEISGSSSGTDIKGIYEADYYVNTLDTSKGEVNKKYLYKDAYGYAIYEYDGTQYNKILPISNLFIYITSSNDIYFLGESGTNIIEVYTKYLEPNVYEVSDILGGLPDNPLEGESYLILNGPYNYSIYQFINNEWVIKKLLITNGLIYNKKQKYYLVLDSRSGNIGINKILTSYEGENIDILKYFEELPTTNTGLSLNTLVYRWNGSTLTFPYYLSYLWYSEATNTGKKFDDFLNLPLRTTDWVKFNGLWISNGAAPDYSGWNINPTIYSDYVQNAGTFIDGLSGTGFRLAKLSLYSSEYPVAITNYNLTIDNLTVRKGIRAYEYVFNLVKATNDSIWVSSSCKLNKVSNIINNELEYYRCYVSTEEDKTDYYVPFKENAIIRCGASLKDPENTITKYYSGVVSSVVNNLEGNRYFDILKSSIEGTGVPEVNDEVVKIGNTLDINDQGAIYLTSSDLYGPYIDILDGVNSPSFSNINPSTGKSTSAVKVRLGNLNGIEDEAFNKYGGVKGYGAYIPNGYFKGTVIITSEGSDISIEDYVNNYVNKLIENFETNVSSNTEFIESIKEGLNLDLDNKVNVYYLGTDPSLDTNWGDPLNHKHDLWFDTTNKVLYCYNPIEDLQGNFWEKIEDLDIISAAQKAEDALNLADSKVTAFTGNNLPSPPYNIGDIWMQGTTGSILYTTIKRDKYKNDSVVPPIEWDLTIGSEDYNLLKPDWVSASKYNDDASIKDFIDTLYKPEEDGVVEIHYGTSFNGLNSPDKGYEWGIEGKDTKAQHEGDLWYYLALNDNNILEDYVFRYTVSTTNNEYSWERVYDSNVIATLKAAKTAEDLADKKRRVFTNTPSVPYDVGDLWMNAPITYPDGTSGVGILVASVSKSLSEQYSKDDWETTNDYVNLETFDEIKLLVLSIFNDNIVILSEKDSLAIIWRQIDSDLQNLILEATGRTKEEWESPTQPVNPGVGILITDDKVLALIKEPNIGSYRVLEYYMTIILDTSGDIDLSTIEDILNLGLTMTYLKILLIFLKYYDDYNTLYLYILDVKTGNYELFVSNTVSTVLGLVDGKIECYFSTTDPKDSWEYPYTEHDGDMWYKKTLDGTIGLLYTWDINIGTDGGWLEITDSNLVQIYDTASRSRDTIDLRRRIFYTTPTPPYDEGDMWVLGLDKDILRSIKSRSKNEVFNLEDWDTALNYSLTVSDISDILDKITDINSQLDGKIDTWYMGLLPNLNGWPDGSDDSTHIGDLWLDTSLNSEGNPRNVIHIFTVEGEEPNLVYSWLEFTDPDILNALENALKAQDTADGKRTIYIEQPIPPYQVGDMWVGRNNETDGSYLICIREKPIIDLETGEIINNEFDINDWEKIDDYPTYDSLPAVGINLISNLNSNWTFKNNTASTYIYNVKQNYYYTISLNSGYTLKIGIYDGNILLAEYPNITQSVYSFISSENTNKFLIEVSKDSGFLIEDLRIKVEEGKKATVFTFSPEDIEAINDDIKDSINSIISDGILVPSEQSKLLLELLRINLEYWRIYNTILALIQYLDGIVADVIPSILDEITAFTDSYNSLINYSINSLKLLSINGELITSASSIIPTTITDLNIILSSEDLSIFTATFINYYELATKILDRIDRLMVDLSSSLDSIIKTTISNILGNNDNSKDWTWDDWALAATKEEGSATLILGGYIRTNLINAQALSITKEGNTVSFSSLFDLYSTINNKGNTLGDTLTDIFTDAIYNNETGTLIVNGYLKSDLIDANTLVIRDNDGLSLGTLINGGYIDTKFIKANELLVNGTLLDLYVDDKVYSGIEDLATTIINELVPDILGTYLVGTGNLLDISLMELGDIGSGGLNNNNLIYNNISTRSICATPIPSGVTKLYLSIDLNHIMAIWFYDWDGNTVGPTDPYVLWTKKEETLEVPSTAKFFRVLIRKLGETASDTLTSYQSILAGATPMVWAGSMKPSSYIENTWTDDLLGDKKNKVIGENDSIIRYLQYAGYLTLGFGYINDNGEIISYSTNYYTYTRLYKLDNVEKIIYLFYSDDSGNNIYFYDKDLLPIKNSYIGRLEISNGVLTTFPPNAKYVRFHLKFGGLVSKGLNVGYLAIVYKDLPPLENLLPYSPGYYVKGNHYNGEAGNDTSNIFYSFIPEYKIPIEEGEMLQFINFLGYTYKEGYSSIITSFYKDGVWVKNGTLNKDTPAVICDGTYNLVCVSVAIISYTNGAYNWAANLFLYQVEDKIKDKLMIVKGTTRPNKWTPCPLDLQDINEDCPNIFSNLLLLIGGSYIGEELNRADRATLKVSYIPVGNNRFIGLNNDGVYKISGLFYNSVNQYIAGTDITLNEGVRVPDKIVVRIPSNAAYFRPIISRMDNGDIDISHVRQNARCMAKFSSLIPTRYIPNENDVIKGTYNILPLNSGEWRRGRLDYNTGAYEAPSETWTYANCNICTYRKVKVKPSTTYIFKGDYTNDDLYAIRFFILSFNLSGQFISRATHEYYENGETFLTDNSTYYILPLILISLRSSNYELLPSIITSNKFILLEGNTINDSAYNNPFIAANPNLAPNTNLGTKNWSFATDTGTYTLTNYIMSRGSGWSVGGVKGIKLSLTKLGSYNGLLYKLDINKFVPYLTVTLSMMIYSDKSFTTNAYIQTPNASYLWHDLAFSIRTTANQWEFIERTVILKSTVPSIDTACYLNIYTPSIATIYIANLKIEEGPVATSYSLSEADLDYNLDEISSSLGYNDFADMVNYAKSGNTIVQGGYIRANMIHIVDPGTGTSGALLTSDGYIYGKYILAKSITANKIDIEDLVASSAFINSLSGTSLNFTKGKIGPLTITENYLGVASGSSAAGQPCVSIGSRYFAVFGGTLYYFRVDADSGGNLGIFLVSMYGNGSLATPLLRITNWNSSTLSGEAINVLGKLYFKGGTLINSYNSDSLTSSGYGLDIQSTGFKVSITNNKLNPPTSSSSGRIVGTLCCDNSISGLWKPVYIYIGSQ